MSDGRVEGDVFLDARDQNPPGTEDSDVDMVEETPGMGRDNEGALMHID